MSSIQNIVVLTGAGIAAESGIATFRGPGGLWEGHRVEDVCTPQALARDPELVHRFYDLRRAALAGVEPNAAHQAQGVAFTDRTFPEPVVEGHFLPLHVFTQMHQAGVGHQLW
jgi:hypothetical protein